MADLAIMIEGQDGLNWPRWQRIASAVEELGFAGLYRSDHFTNASPPDKDSLELWVSLTWLAVNSRRLQFGPLVTPASLRHPVHTARMAAAVDNLSGGRLRLGLGAGWNEYEHRKFGFDLLPVPERFARFEEAAQVITRLLRGDEPVDFRGRFYHLEQARLLPRPRRPGSPAIVIGGNGEKRTLPLVARFADEWNLVSVPPEEFRRLNARLDERLVAEGRRPDQVRRTMMSGTIFAPDSAGVRRKVEARYGGQRTPEQLRQRGLLVGAIPELIDQLGALAEAGAQRFMLQWLELDDLDGLEALAAGLLPHFHS